MRGYRSLLGIVAVGLLVACSPDAGSAVELPRFEGHAGGEYVVEEHGVGLCGEDCFVCDDCRGRPVGLQSSCETCVDLSGACGKPGCVTRMAIVGQFNCCCSGSYKFPVPPQYTYHWPGMYSAGRMTDYRSPWRFPGLRSYDEIFSKPRRPAKSSVTHLGPPPRLSVEPVSVSLRRATANRANPTGARARPKSTGSGNQWAFGLQ